MPGIAQIWLLNCTSPARQDLYCLLSVVAAWETPASCRPSQRRHQSPPRLKHFYVTRTKNPSAFFLS
jgi:hypothetical protein